MAIPITKKAASSCAKNMAETLISGAGALGKSQGFVDAQGALEGNMKNKAGKISTKPPSVEENLENEEGNGEGNGEGNEE